MKLFVANGVLAGGLVNVIQVKIYSGNDGNSIVVFC